MFIQVEKHQWVRADQVEVVRVYGGMIDAGPGRFKVIVDCPTGSVHSDWFETEVEAAREAAAIVRAASVQDAPKARYVCMPNQHNVPYFHGPRVSGEHRNVYDVWEGVTQSTRRIPGLALCRCLDCGAEWPEGGDRDPACPAGRERV